MKVCAGRMRISFGKKTGMNSYDLYGNKISSRYHVNRGKQIYGDGMNSFRSFWYHVNSP